MSKNDGELEKKKDKDPTNQHAAATRKKGSHSLGR